MKNVASSCFTLYSVLTNLLCRVTKGRTVHCIELEARKNKSNQIKQT